MKIIFICFTFWALILTDILMMIWMVIKVLIMMKIHVQVFLYDSTLS